MKLHLGAGNKIIPGYTNCDFRSLPGIDKIFDLETFPYPFKDNSVSYILTMETLEHLSFVHMPKIFKELYRILEPNGMLSIQVPDIGKMCEYYVNKEICPCVPHKVKNDADFLPDPNCSLCKGTAKINNIRWTMAFCGAQKHPLDFHKMMFTKENMTDLLKSAGFDHIKFTDHVYKIKVVADK